MVWLWLKLVLSVALVFSKQLCGGNKRAFYLYGSQMEVGESISDERKLIPAEFLTIL